MLSSNSPWSHFFIAGRDYNLLSNEFDFTNDTTSHNLTIEIMANDDNEAFMEHFEVVMSGMSMHNAFGAEVQLSENDASRIITTSSRARVDILDGK